MSLELIKDSKKLGNKIASISKRGKALDTDIHLCAVSCLHHAMEHGDTTLSTRLVDAMPKSGRRKALVHWFGEHSMMSYSEKESCFRMTKSKSKSWKLAAAEKVPFWEFTTEKEPKALTIEQLIKSVTSRIKKAKEDNKLDDGFSIKAFEAKLHQELGTIEA